MKHQRDWAEEAEINVTDAINGNTASIHIKSISNNIIDYILKNYNCKIDYAKWVGNNSYDDKGDVHVFLLDKSKIPVELKFSRNKGSGTKANSTTAILKKRINSNIKTYPEFDENLGLKEQRYQLVSKKIGKSLKRTAEYNRALRSIRDNNELAFLEDIAKITSPGQEKYAIYAAKELNKNLDKVNLWVKTILDGNNTTADVDITDNLVYCVIKNFEKNNQTIEFYDFTDMDSNITYVTSVGKSIKLQNKSGKDVRRLSVTWKNICQGGATPCFNIFVGNAFTS